MPIRPLSDATSRVLVSTQALNDATSVVKELVENALDARATSISVEISTNTLEKIIVKDDGNGIGVEDRQLLCKSGCTSKIANLDDLAALGGSCLGFRGTALASIAELSKEVTVVTRVDGEQPATTLTFGSIGQLLSSASASHNVGTTVRVENFLAMVPVRRQFTLKNTSKILDDIRKLLQGYALVRPKVKLSLKVLKAKNEKFNWSFAACKGEDLLMSAAIQVVGNPVANLCRLYTTHLEDDDDESGYSAEALMLDTANNDFPKASNGGQHLAIDRRPVSHDKGVMKDVVKLYKSYLKHATESSSSIGSKPFLILHIQCPGRSYDVDIEPAKDVVLFHDSQKVLNLAKKLFVSAYGELGEQQQNKKQVLQQGFNETTASSFDILLPRKRPHTETENLPSREDMKSNRTETQFSESDSRQNDEKSATESFAEAMEGYPSLLNTMQTRTDMQLDQPTDTTPKTPGNMHTIYDDLQGENMETNNLSEGLEEEEAYDPSSTIINNPFIRAKALSLHRPRESKNSIDEPHATSKFSRSLRTVDDSKNAMDNLESTASQGGESSVQHLPTPNTSPFNVTPRPYQNPGPPFQRRNKRSHGEGEEEHSDGSSFSSEQQQQSIGPQQSLLNSWVRSPQPTVSFPGFQRVSLGLSSSPYKDQLSPPLSQPPQAQFSLKKSQASMNVNHTPFRSPLKISQTEVLTTSGHKDSEFMNIGGTGTTPANTSQDDDDDLRHILDFEQRKRTINQRLKSNQAVLNPAGLARIRRSSDTTVEHVDGHTSQTMSEVATSSSGLPIDLTRDFDEVQTGPRSHTTPSKRSNPHHNRYLAAVRNLQSPDKSSLQSSTSTNPKDAGLQKETRTIPTEPQRGLLYAPKDPRAFLISLNAPLSHSDVSNGKTKRCKSARLPFETIASDLKKHDVLAIPQSPTPSESRIQVLAQALAHSDAYVKRGVIPSIEWSPTGKEIKRWQDTLEEMVKKQYRAKHSTDGEEEENVTSVPNIEISLARVLKVHIDSR